MIERLGWDSDFFGYAVGRMRVQAGPVDRATLDRAAEGFALVYVLADAALSGIPLFDVKVVLERAIGTDDGSDRSANVEQASGPADEALYQLALESGVHSRFRLDPGFRANEFERLYRRWLENALSAADQLVLVTKDVKGTTGFVSLTHGEGISTIGLIAVHERARGQGIGSRLIAASIAETRRVGNSTLRVVTQEANTPAMALYARCGFHVAERTFVHHLRPGTGNG